MHYPILAANEHRPMQTPASLQNLDIRLSAACVEQVNHPLLESSGVCLLIKREDRLHPVISGNKWRKLKYLLSDAINRQHTHLISMGGPWSNHLHALAWAGKQCGLGTTGIIRGERPIEESDTIIDLRRWGMQLEFISRAAFRELRQYQSADSPPTLSQHGYWIPEGGACGLALRGVAEMLDEVEQDYDVITTACGTGTTLAGLLSTLPTQKHAIGFPAIKGGEYLHAEILTLLASVNTSSTAKWCLNTDYHFGGFGKQTPELLNFMQDFERHSGIPLEPIYTGKMFYGLFDLIQRGYFSPGTRVLALHTGGLQGRRSLN